MRPSSTILKNFFSTAPNTKTSFISQFLLADKRLGGDGFFAGRADSPLASVLHANGYKIQTGYSEDLFGVKGPYVDEYVHPDKQDAINNSTLCGLSNQKEKILKLYGFCPLYAHFNPSNPDDSLSHWYHSVKTLISQKAEDNRPWMTINYIHNPMDHTPSTFNGRDKKDRDGYIASYKQKSKKTMIDVLSHMVKTIKTKDPGSIVLFYGDHGPVLSRGIPVEENLDFNVPDRYAIFGSIYKNKHRCSNPANVNHYQDSYITIERLTAGIFRCLAKDPSAVDKAVDFGEPYDFGKYLYDN
jgi:hypothetical protein